MLNTVINFFVFDSPDQIYTPSTYVHTPRRCTSRHRYILSVSKTSPSTRSLETRCRQFRTPRQNFETRLVTVWAELFQYLLVLRADRYDETLCRDHRHTHDNIGSM